MIRNLSLKLLPWLPPVLWMALIFFQSSQTGLAGPAWMSVVGHIVEYSVLASLYYAALRRTTELKARHVWLIAALAATLYGITDEWHQSFVPGRTPDLADIRTDAAAAFVAAAVMWLFAGKPAPSSGRKADELANERQ